MIDLETFRQRGREKPQYSLTDSNILRLLVAAASINRLTRLEKNNRLDI